MTESMLTKEKAETKKRVALLKTETGLEKLRKEVSEREYELVILKRPSIFGWIKKLFKKGGENNGCNSTQTKDS